MQVRVYVNGEKVFCNFDWEKFLNYLTENTPDEDASLANPILRQALTIATGRITEDKETFGVANFEW